MLLSLHVPVSIIGEDFEFMGTKLLSVRGTLKRQIIMQTVHPNAYHEDNYGRVGIKISEKLAQVEARILRAPWVVASQDWPEFPLHTMLMPSELVSIWSCRLLTVDQRPGCGGVGGGAGT